MQYLEGKEIEFVQNFIRQGFASGSHNGRIFRLLADMASNACSIGSSVVEFILHDMGDLSESIAHVFD